LAIMESATLTSSAATELRESVMAVARQMRRHRPDNGMTLSQMQLLGEISRAGVTTPADYSAAPAASGASVTPVDTALSNTGGVEPVIPISGLIMVLSGAGCLLVERRRAGSGSAPAAGAGEAPADE